VPLLILPLLIVLALVTVIALIPISRVRVDGWRRST